MRARLATEKISLIIEQGEDGCAYLVWFGPKTSEDMALRPAFQRLPASPDRPVGPVLLPEHGTGFHGIAQIEGFCGETRKRVRLGRPEIIEQEDRIILHANDRVTGIGVSSEFRFDAKDTLVVSTRVSHEGHTSVHLQRMASALLPTPDWASEVLTHAGAWSREGHPARRRWTTGRIEQAGRSGRPGFDGGPTLTMCEAGTGEDAGRALTAHLAWSGPFRLAVEKATDGSGQLLAERLFAAGECQLNNGDSIELPECLIAISGHGLNGVSAAFHEAFRARSRPIHRRVQFNTWEARYFEIDETRCIALAREAAALGAERFVLDDGWFMGRRDDTTSLGDWAVDTERFPNGLQPLVDAVHAEEMDFGLWVEPEMVSPDSDLFRAHPDWVLGHPDRDLATGRNQLVLDLALPAVQDHLHGEIASLLDTYPIAYLKWDCNRDLYPATRYGVARPGDQTEGLYTLLDRLLAAHPDVEIESCASGGGRIDAGIGRFVNRFWTSDATDAIERVRIQRAASLVVPPEMLGTHVGPSPNPITRRQIPMAFRVLTAMFGHFGIEADPGNLSEADRAILARGINIYRSHRVWMTGGRWYRISQAGADPDVQMVTAGNGAQALLRILRTSASSRPHAPHIRLVGLQPDARYRLTELAIEGEPELWPLGEYTGAGLMSHGLALDPGSAVSGRLIHLERAD